MKYKKSFGQNFLVDKLVLAKIIETANLAGDETVVEVGGGDGFLTRALARKIQETRNNNQTLSKILSLEFDYRLVEKLRGEFKNSKIVKIIHQDALKFDWEGLPKNYKIVANIPYQITSPLLNLWTFQLKNQPESLTLMVQKEVGERLTAPPGSAKRGLTTILVELYGKAEYIQTVPAKAFYPVPKVESAIIKITKHQETITNYDNQKSIIKIAKMGFSAKRRTVSNSLAGTLRLPKNKINAILESVDINSQRRAETLTIYEWENLTKKISVIYD